MTNRTARLLAAFLLAAPLLGPGAVPASAAPSTEPMCVFLIPDGGGEALINRCRACREVTLERARAGEGIPNVRAMMLPAAGVTPAPFRGPGRTRIVGERACPQPPGRSVSAATSPR